jgi:hypothetical protein
VRYGGRLHFKRSPHHRLIFRTLWESKDGRFWYYGPLFPRRDWRAVYHKIWFHGEVREATPEGKHKPRRRLPVSK